MKYVGATNGFIRFPFFVEGVAVGFVAGLLASVCVLGGYQLLIVYADQLPAFWGELVSGILIPFDQLWWKLVLAFFGFGGLLGSLGTAFSIRKHLKV